MSPHPTVALPIRSSDDGEVSVSMAAGPDGGAYVSIAHPDGAVLLLLDREGRPRPGWPIPLPHTTRCHVLRTAADGTARLVCDALDLPQPDVGEGTERAFAYGTDGGALPGWPVDVAPTRDANVAGDDLLLLTDELLGDTFEEGAQTDRIRLVTISASGTIARHEEAGRFYRECGGDDWVVGPDGRAYGTERFLESCEEWDPTVPTWTTLTQLREDGVPRGWPVRLDGLVSLPAVAPSGRINAVQAEPEGAPSTVVAFDASGTRAASSRALPIETAGSGDLCAAAPEPPVIGADGVLYVASRVDPVIYALDGRLAVLPGWPFRPDAGLEYPWLGNVTDGCPPPVAPAAAPDGSLSVALSGGQLTSVGRDGDVRPGWPVRLRRDGARWDEVLVAADGTIFGLALEPEGGEQMSATVLAIDPDGTVRGKTTIVEP